MNRLFRYISRSTIHKTSKSVMAVKHISSGTVAATLYACTFSAPTALGAVPEESRAKPHHLKNGKGFTNPWESWADINASMVISGIW